MKKNVVVSILGPTLDAGYSKNRWNRWRPNVALCQHEDLLFDKFELITQAKFSKLSNLIKSDVESVSPEKKGICRVSIWVIHGILKMYTVL